MKIHIQIHKQIHSGYWRRDKWLLFQIAAKNYSEYIDTATQRKYASHKDLTKCFVVFLLQIKQIAQSFSDLKWLPWAKKAPTLSPHPPTIDNAMILMKCLLFLFMFGIYIFYTTPRTKYQIVVIFFLLSPTSCIYIFARPLLEYLPRVSHNAHSSSRQHHFCISVSLNFFISAFLYVCISVFLYFCISVFLFLYLFSVPVASGAACCSLAETEDNPITSLHVSSPLLAPSCSHQTSEMVAIKLCISVSLYFSL